MMKCLVIVESIIDEKVLEQLAPYLTETRNHSLSRILPVCINTYEIPEMQVWPFVESLSRALKPERFYAHFVAGNLMIVVFPHTICLVDKGSPSQADKIRCVGHCFGIPDIQMQFEKMFEQDHPDAE